MYSIFNKILSASVIIVLLVSACTKTGPPGQPGLDGIDGVDGAASMTAFMSMQDQVIGPSCHGTEGKGDGVMSKNLKTFAGDFTTEEFHNYTDGEIYYQSIIGRDEMPNYEKLIPDEEDRWAVINHIRAMKK